MPKDPMYDAVLLNLAEVQNTMQHLLCNTPDTIEYGPLRFEYFSSVQRLERDIMKRLHRE